MVTYIFPNIALAGTAECLDGKDLALLHFRLVVALDNGHAFAAVNDVLVNVVTVQVSDTLHRVHGTIELDLVAFHGFLDGGSDITHADVNTSFLSAG